MTKASIARVLESRFVEHFNNPLAGTSKHEDFLKSTLVTHGMSIETLNKQSRDAFGLDVKQLFWQTRVMAAARKIIVSKDNQPSLLRWYGYHDLNDLDKDLRSRRGLTLNAFGIRYRKECRC